jgi:phage tail sheath protein FI
MPNIQRPGVYVAETLTPLSSALSSPGDAIAAFVAENAQGPTKPTLITSWSQYLTLFGGFGDGQHLLPYAVFSFFANGGSQAYVMRAAPGDASTATISLNNRAGSPAALLKLTASSPGSWGNSLQVTVSNNGGNTTGRFDLLVTLGGTQVERWLDMSMNPGDPRYVVGALNSPTNGSAFLVAGNLLSGASNYHWVLEDTPAVQTGSPLTAGLQGSTAADLAAAVESFDVVDVMMNINLPGVTDVEVLTSVIQWAEARGDVFVIIDAPPLAVADTSADQVTDFLALASTGSGVVATSYAAIYGPWINIKDPSSSVTGAVRPIPPGGAVAGVYSRTDAQRGVSKAPAGVDAVISGAVSTVTTFSDSQLDQLNQAGINVIRRIAGAGFVIWGARTLKSGFPDRYVSTRRTLMSIRKALLTGVQFAVFEPNTPALQATVRSRIGSYLANLFQQSVLAGNSIDQAFFVTCDASNNPPSSVASGELHVEVGIALLSPAEFIIINLGQYQGSATVTETL